MNRLLAIFSLILFPVILLAVDKPDCDPGDGIQCEQEYEAERQKVAMLAGPEQVDNRLHIDSNQVTPMFPRDFAKGYFDWKARIKKDHGVTLGGDYSAVYLSEIGRAHV